LLVDEKSFSPTPRTVTAVAQCMAGAFGWLHKWWRADLVAADRVVAEHLRLLARTFRPMSVPGTCARGRSRPARGRLLRNIRIPAHIRRALRTWQTAWRAYPSASP
jgi:hypothetical protein